jgi:hypothetical protein
MTNRDALDMTERCRKKRLATIAELEESIRELRKQVEEVDPVLAHLRTLPPDLPLGQGAGVESPEFGKCSHPKEQRGPGPRIPLRYGSAATEVCSACGGYRQTRIPNDRWEPGPPDTSEDEEL